MKKVVIIILCIILISFGSLYLIDMNRMKNNLPVLFSTWGNDYIPSTEFRATTNMKIVLSLEDEITENSAWCGTFNLIWNDYKNDIVKQNIVFNPQLKIVENLNKGTFNTSCLSEESYYKVYGIPSPQLKDEIEKAIKDKFNETSDILDDFDWNGEHFLYAMLKKDFEFPKVFTELENGTFGEYENVKYFGINPSTDSEVGNQVSVLYYNSKTDFAIELKTKGDDEVIISRGNKEKTFGKIYEEILEEQKNYRGNKSFHERDTLKMPNITFKLKEELTELQNKPFLFSDGSEHYIQTAIQTIQFELDKKGGKIKSEAGMMDKLTAILQDDKPREFVVDNTFVIFLKEEGKKLPYFGAQISDISQVQSDIKKQTD